MLCTGESQASVLGIMVQGRGAGEVRGGHRGAASMGNLGQFHFWQVSVGGILGVI